MVEDGLVLSMMMAMSEHEDFGGLCATVSWNTHPDEHVNRDSATNRTVHIVDESSDSHSHPILLAVCCRLRQL